MHDSRRTRLILGVLLAVAIALITLDARGGNAAPVRGLRAVGGAIFGSAEYVTGAVTRPVAGLLHNLGSGPASAAKIAQLQREVVQLRGELSQAQLSQQAEAQLRQMLQLAGRGRYRVVAANVIAVGPAFEDTATIDAGAADGIRPGQTVLNGAGLVGTVTAVSGRTATVLLATDASATVGVRIAGTNEIGAVTGTGRGQAGPDALRLQVFDASAVLHPGERLVTYGSVHGRPYVPGVPVGVITRIQAGASALTKIAYVRPFANGALGVVGVVIVPPRTNPRDSVLPPSPQPTLSPTPAPTASAGASPGPGGTPSPGPSVTPTAGG